MFWADIPQDDHLALPTPESNEMHFPSISMLL
jgi:hypothetical protein